MKGVGAQMKTSSRHKTLKEWFSALSPKLQQLVREAEGQSWPFVYEEWQFEQDSNKKIVNIKDLIQSKNAVHPDMTEEDVLKKCLDNACSEKAFERAAAVAFLLDRLMYLHGNSKYILDKVDYIQQEAPSTAIAPQVYLRKARFLKDGGSLQDADKTLDFILAEKGHKEQWQYKEESQYDLVHATCVQVKGVIRHNLGLWLEAADLVLESILRYNSLPKPDLKGIGSSLGILSDILRNISQPDFKQLLSKYACRYDNPLEEAYAANRQAAWLARFDPFFFARNTRRAGEVLLMFVITLPQEDRPKLLTQALNDLKMSLKGHLSLAKLTSREQLNELTCAVYQCFIAYSLMGNPEAISKAIEIEKYCMVIYGYNCASAEAVPLEENFVKAIHKVHDLLELPRLGAHAPEINELVNIPAYEYQYPTLRGAGTSTPNQIDAQVVSCPKETADSQAQRSRFRTRVKRHAIGVTAGKDKQSDIEVPVTTHAHSISESQVPILMDPVADTQPSERPPVTDTSLVTEHRSDTQARLPRFHPRPNKQAIGSTAGKMREQKERDTAVADLSAMTTSISTVSLTPTLMDPEADTRPSKGQPAVTADSSRRPGIAVEMEDQERPIQQIIKSGGDQNEESDTSAAAVHPLVLLECQNANDDVECASGTGDLGEDLELSNEAASLADDLGVDDSSVDTGYSGSTQGSVNPELGDESILSRKQGVEIDEYVESVQPKHPDDKPLQLPKVFLQPDLSSPINSFVDSTLPVLPGQTVNPSTNVEMTRTTNSSYHGLTLTAGERSLKPLSVHRARVFKFDAAQSEWICLTTLVYVDEELDVGRKGAMRDVIKLQYLDQDEPKARYVGKRYREARRKKPHLYYQDVICQMTARHFVALFNQSLKDDHQAWKIQFVPAAHIQLLSDDHKDIVDLFNVEPYVEGSDFVKVTNNYKYVNPRLNQKLVEVSLAFMHFTWDKSDGRILVTDLQGWLPRDQNGTIIFTDPAIHSETLKSTFVTANLGEDGTDTFWRHQHPKCNDICYSLGIKRPQ